MPEQLLLDPLQPAAVLREADRRYGPFVARFCLTSGGRDSAALAHVCRDEYDALVFVNTGTALPGVAEHVERLAAWIGKPLIVRQTDPSEYDRLVLGSATPRANGKPDVGAGFPGPGLHGSCYTRLKERQIEAVQREAKIGYPRKSRVLFLTGVRRAESGRRARRAEITKKRGRVFVNPLIDWRNFEVADYAERVGIPESAEAALLHRSGECNCGAFAAPGEREMLAALWPEWFAARIAPLERAAEAAGYGPAARWGHGLNLGEGTVAGEMCSSCEPEREPLAV